MNENIISESIIINRSQQDIWDYITTPENWKVWYVADDISDDLIEVIPDWQEGGILSFASGQKPKIQECVPPALLRWGGGGGTYIELTGIDSSSTKIELGYVAEGFLVEDPMLWAEFRSRYLDAVEDILNGLKSLLESQVMPAAKEQETSPESAEKESKDGKTILGPVARSEKLIELFNREKIDPSGKKILAFALLYEYELNEAPMVWVGPGPDPFAVEGESAEDRQTRFLGSKIIPGYQPQFIPAHLAIDSDTAVAGRRLRDDERLETAYINQVLAVMLAGLLTDQDLSNCSALSLSGESHALGRARFAIVVGIAEPAPGNPEAAADAGIQSQTVEETAESKGRKIREGKKWKAAFWIGLLILIFSCLLSMCLPLVILDQPYDPFDVALNAWACTPVFMILGGLLMYLAKRPAKPK